MPVHKFEKFLPVSGVLAGILFAVNGLVAKVPGEAGDPEMLRMVKDNAGSNTIAALAGGLCCVALLFFVTGVRQAIRSGESGESTFSSAAYAGGVLLAGSVALSGWVLLATTDAAVQNDGSAVSALGYLGFDAWLPWVAASAVFFLATGIGGLSTAALPKWLSIVTIVLGVLCLLGPTGVAVFFATPVWLIVAGAVLTLRLRRAATTGIRPEQAEV